MENNKKEEIANYLKEHKPMMLGQIAKEFSLSEFDTAKNLPTEMISFAGKDDFEEIWNELVGWERCTFIVQALGSVFEICGKLNKGAHGRGYFNLHGAEALNGHLKVDDLAGIGFMSMPFMGLESHSVLFFNEAGEVKFSVYVGRENKVLIPEARTSFLSLQAKYAE